MEPAVQVILSGALTFGVPLALAARELFVLRRPGRGPGGRDDGRSPTPAPRPSGDAPAQKPLPDCLIPKLLPSAAPISRTRVLETVDG